jgi:hypothetical protein
MEPGLDRDRCPCVTDFRASLFGHPPRSSPKTKGNVNRRLAKDYERHASTALAFVVLAAVFVLLQRMW